MSVLPPFGSDVPFAEPPDLQGQFSPFYDDRHREWRAKCRKFVEEEIMPFIEEWDEEGDIPHVELREKAYKLGIYAPLSPVAYGGTPPQGSEGDWHSFLPNVKVDPFYDLIMWDELARCASGGLVATLFGSGPAGIGLPPIFLFGNDFLKAKVARDVVTGKKTLCLCVTEPSGGSDVAAIRTTAVRDGDHYIINGSKKWITGGMKAEYFTVVCRTNTEKAGHHGLSMILLERDMPGISLRRMKTQGWWMSNTTFIEFDNVRVPVANLVGKEGEGFKYTMINFNHERFMMTVQSVRFARVCLEESIRFAQRRQTFGKKLIEHQVIRHKIADMARRIEGVHRQVENVAYQVKMGLPDHKIGGYIALMKVDGTRLMEYCAREASQIFGGQSFTREGAGGKVERIYREVRVMAIGGGSEEVMLNLAMTQAKL